LGAQSTQLGNGGVEVIIGGTSPLPGQQTPVELNDKDEVMVMLISLSIPSAEPLPSEFRFCTCNDVISCIESSIDGGQSYMPIDRESVTCEETDETPGSREVRVQVSVEGLQDPSSPPLETGFRIVLSPIPIPPAVWLFGSALGLLVWIRRKAT
jgi:hypothetical protein